MTDVAPLDIGIVGHTNAGKTSLVRTLTRNRSFGEVEDRGGTTRRVSAASLDDGHTTRLRLWDSPGLENAPALLEHRMNRAPSVTTAWPRCAGSWMMPRSPGDSPKKPVCWN